MLLLVPPLGSPALALPRRRSLACLIAALLQGATATLGIYVDSGSVYESPANTGVQKFCIFVQQGCLEPPLLVAFSLQGSGTASKPGNSLP